MMARFLAGTLWVAAEPWVNGSGGQHRVCLRLGGGRNRIVSVHRIVLAAFVGPCPDGMEGCHNDGNPANNRIENLRWDTHVSNMADKTTHGTIAVGERHGCSVLTAEDVREMRSLYATGNYKQRDLAKRFGVVQATVYYIVNRITWKEQAA